MMTKRIGGTKYKVRITFNENGQETMEDKVLRMIQNDLDDTAQKSYDFFKPRLPKRRCLWYNERAADEPSSLKGVHT